MTDLAREAAAERLRPLVVAVYPAALDAAAAAELDEGQYETFDSALVE